MMTSRVGDFINLSIRDGILHAVYLPNSIINLETAKLIVAEKISLCKDIDYPTLMDLRYLKSASADAREYFSNTDEGNANISAGAIFVESKLSTMFGNLYLAINQPKKPTKLFADKDSALE